MRRLALVTALCGALLPSLLYAGSYTGDVTCDSRVTPVDAQLLLQLEAGVATLEDPPGDQVWCWGKGDVNDDESLDAADAMLILQLDARLILHLPYEE